MLKRGDLRPQACTSPTIERFFSGSHVVFEARPPAQGQAAASVFFDGECCGCRVVVVQQLHLLTHRVVCILMLWQDVFKKIVIDSTNKATGEEANGESVHALALQPLCSRNSW